MEYNIQRKRIDSKSKEDVLAELISVAHKFNGRRFSRHEFDKTAASCKGTTVLKIFGSWSAALQAMGVTLTPYKASRLRLSEEELLSELERVWKRLGHRPSKDEWENAGAMYSYTTYKQRFGGWKAACEQVVKGFSKPDEVSGNVSVKRESNKIIKAEEKRGIPLKLRLKVLLRDRSTCVLCGHAPNLNPGTMLEIDHIVPFARGGKSTLDNLRTLCHECNLGKGAA